MSILEELNLFFTKRHAHRDAAHDIDGGSRRQLARLGANPRDEAIGTHQYRQAVNDANQAHRVAELEDELRRAEDLRSVVGTPWIYNIGLLAVGVVEAIGAFIILQAQGVAPAHRPFLAVGLSITLIASTRAAAAAAEKSDGGTSLLIRAIVVVGYAILVAAIVFIRVNANDDGEASRSFAFADGALLLAVTVGPALVAAWMEKKRGPAAQLAGQLSLIRSRLRAARRLVERARKYLEGVDRAAVAHTRSLTRTEAQYSVERDIARSEGTGTPRA